MGYLFNNIIYFIINSLVMSTCNLKECFLIADMDRLDHPQYFQFDFQCSELDDFFKQVKDNRKIFHKINRNLLNLFFDRLIGKKSKCKNLYIRLKWLIYLHQIIFSLGENSPLFHYIEKALSYFGEWVENEGKRYGPYEKYLLKLLVKPYVQYLSKLCMLKENDIENSNSINYMESEMKWFQIYNFVLNACETFR